MMLIKRFFLPIAILVMIAGCSRGISRQEYVAWVRSYENGLHVQKQSGEFTFDLQYQPSAYVLLQRNPQLTKEVYAEEVKEIEGLQYYILTISLTDKSQDIMTYDVQDEAQVQRKQYYFSYLFQNDIVLEDNGKTLPCVLYHFERSVDLKSGRTFVLAFETAEAPSEEATLLITGEVFGSLPVKIKVSKANVPSVTL